MGTAERPRSWWDLDVLASAILMYTSGRACELGLGHGLPTSVLVYGLGVNVLFYWRVISFNLPEWMGMAALAFGFLGEGLLVCDSL